MEQIELSVVKREILGKKVRFLRRKGIIPTHVFGHDIESLALQCEAAQLRRVLAKAGATRLISLKLDKAEEPRNVVVREIQREPDTGELLHVDFYQVKMTEKIEMKVPIVLIGEAPALKSKDNMLYQELSNLNIECLPAQIPQSIEIDLSVLAETDQSIHVRDVVLGEGIAILNNPEQIVVKVGLRPVEKAEVVEKPVAEEAVAEGAEATGGATAEGEKEGT